MPRTRVHAEAGCPRGPREPRLWSCRRSPNPHSGRRRRPAQDRGRASRSRSPVPGGAWGGRGVGGRPGSPSFQVPELETNGTRFGVFIFHFWSRERCSVFARRTEAINKTGPRRALRKPGARPETRRARLGFKHTAQRGTVIVPTGRPWLRSFKFRAQTAKRHEILRVHYCYYYYYYCRHYY